MEELIELTLPPIVFLNGDNGNEDTLSGRVVLLHVRTASVVEIFESDKAFLAHDVSTFNFHYKDSIYKSYVAAAHYVNAKDRGYDKDLAFHVFMDCAIFYVEYLENKKLKQ
jgi:hypothetical protein